jgi:hypothetical protein
VKINATLNIVLFSMLRIIDRVSIGSFKLFGNERVKYLCAFTDVIIFVEILGLGLNFCWRVVLGILIQALSLYVRKYIYT